jgi:hypothetical protein
MSTRVLAGLLSLLWCRRSRSHRKPWLSVPWLCALWRRDRESCCISMFWKPGSYVVMLDHCHLTVVSPIASCGRAHPWHLGVHSSMPSRYGHLMDTQYRKGQAALSMTASAGRNCVDKQALCLVASSLSTSHASSSFFLASEAAFSRAPKRPLAIVLVTSPNLYSLLPVASRTAPSKPLMAPRVKSPNS